MNKYLALIFFLIFGLGLHVYENIQRSLAVDSVYISLPALKKSVPKAVAQFSPVVEVSPVQIKKIEKRKVVKKLIKNFNNVSYADVENLDFIPSVSQPKENESTPVVKHVFVEKSEISGKINLDKKIEVQERTITKKDITKKNYELSYDKISEQVYKPTTPLEIVAFDEVDPFKYKIEKIAKTEIKEDRISTEASALEKSTSKYKIPKTKKDDIVFYDYSTPVVQKEIVKEEQKVSSEVGISTPKIAPIQKSLPKPEVAEPPVIKTVEAPAPKASIPVLAKFNAQAMENLEESIKKLQVVEPKKKQVKVAMNEGGNNVIPQNSEPEGFTKSGSCDYQRERTGGYSYDYSLELLSVGATTKTENIHNFELRFHDDLDSIQRDYGEGSIRISGDVAGDMNIRRGTFYAKGHYPVTLDLVIEDAEAKISIPSFSMVKMEDISAELGISDRGAHLLLELDQTTEDIEIGVDHKYKAKVFLNKNYQIVDRETSDYYFIAFFGLEAGNTIVNYKRSNNDVVTKIIHLAEDELYYDPNFYAEFSRDSFSLFEEGVLSNCPTRLDINADKLKPWAHGSNIRKANLNSYEAKNVSYPMGSRKYVQLGHLQEPVFIGSWNQENIIVPSEDYIDQVLKQFDVRGGECIVQINLKKQLKEINYSGMSATGGLNIDTKVLDKDGKFYTDPSDQSKRLFFMGESQGIINIEVIYLDNSKSYLQTYCSENTYLVEQL